MKKTLVLLAKILSAYGVFAFADNSWMVGGYTYHYNVLPGGIDISPCFNTSSHNYAPAVSPTPTGDFVIPDRLPDYVSTTGVTNLLPIVNIGHFGGIGRYAGSGRAFSSGSMTSVVIPNTVTNIGITAFAGCTALESVRFPLALRSIESYSFTGSSRLRQIELPTGLERIGPNAFSGCTGLVSVALHEGLKQIDSKAFSSSYVYSHFDLSGNFSPCISLTSIEIPNSVTNIGTRAFSGCTSLQTAVIGGGDIGSNAFSDCIALSDVTLGENVTSIGECAFYGCANLTRITIGGNVKAIGRNAFYGCAKLTEIVLPVGLEEIGEDAFLGCTNIMNVVVPGHLGLAGFPINQRAVITNALIAEMSARICADAFRSCYNLKNVTISDSVRSIGASAFEGCGLEEVRLPAGLTNMEASVFLGTCLKSLPSFPYGITAIPDSAFASNRGLVDIAIPDGIGHIGDNAFSWCQLLSSVTIPDSVTNIGNQAFFANLSLTNIVIGANVKSLGFRAFFGCALEHVMIPAGVENLYGSMAFGGCNLSSALVLGDIDGLSGVFDYCYGLNRIIVLGNVTEESPDGSFFDDVPDDLVVYVTPAFTASVETWGERKVKVVSRAAAAIIGRDEQSFHGWLTPSALKLAGNDVFVAADLMAANGRRNFAECYALGIDPEDQNDDLRIAEFKMKDGKPVITLNHTKDGSGNSFEDRVKILGRVELTEGGWQEVPPEGNPTHRFFTVDVEMP